MRFAERELTLVERGALPGDTFRQRRILEALERDPLFRVQGQLNYSSSSEIFRDADLLLLHEESQQRQLAATLLPGATEYKSKHAFDPIRIQGENMVSFARATFPQSRTITLMADTEGLVLIANDGQRTAFGRLDGLMHATVRSTLNELTLVKPNGPAAVFVDDSALRLLNRMGLEVDGWRVYRSGLSSRPLWNNVRVQSQNLASRLAEIANRPLPGRRRLVNLVGDKETRALEYELFAESERLVLDTGTTTEDALDRLLSEHSGEMLFFLAHIEDDLVAGLGISTRQLLARCREHKVLPVVMGCNSAESGSGVMGQIVSGRAAM